MSDKTEQQTGQQVGQQGGAVGGKPAAAQIVDEAMNALMRAHVTHYAERGEDWTRARLTELHAVVAEALDLRDVTTVVRFAEKIAVERFHAGFSISEVQSSFNVIEQAMWKHLLAVTPPAQLIEAIVKLSTVLGAGKDSLARTYVAMAMHRHVPAIDVKALFAGTESPPTIRAV